MPPTAAAYLAGVRPALRALAVALVAFAAPRAGGVAAHVDRSGTYRLHGKARVAAKPLLDRDVDANGDAVLAPGPGPTDVRARLAAEGYACELVAQLGADGALLFAEGQRCALEVQRPDAKGHLDATLSSGRGALRGGDELDLDLSWDVAGRLSLRTGRTIEVLGTRVDVPAAWLPETPVHGTARATVSGHRDRSRAAEP